MNTSKSVSKSIRFWILLLKLFSVFKNKYFIEKQTQYIHIKVNNWRFCQRKTFLISRNCLYLVEWVLLNSSRKNFGKLKNGTTRLQKYTFFQNWIYNRSARRRQKLWALSNNLVFNVARHRKSVTRRCIGTQTFRHKFL